MPQYPNLSVLHISLSSRTLQSQLP